MATINSSSGEPASSPWPDHRNPLPARPARAARKQAGSTSATTNKSSKKNQTEMSACWEEDLQSRNNYDNLQGVERDLPITSTEKSPLLQAAIESLEANIQAFNSVTRSDDTSASSAILYHQTDISSMFDKYCKVVKNQTEACADMATLRDLTSKNGRLRRERNDERLGRHNALKTLGETSDRAVSFKAQLNNLAVDRAVLERQLKAAAESNDATTAENSDLKAAVIERESSYACLRKQQTEIEKERDALLATNKSLADGNKQLQMEVSDLKEELQRLKKLNENTADFQRRYNHYKQLSTATSEENRALKQRVQSMNVEMQRKDADIREKDATISENGLRAYQLDQTVSKAEKE
ncbi:MAG: hypothetical protein Q9211_004692 [Gyalolechia sp. 1 TL-2023]